MAYSERQWLVIAAITSLLMFLQGLSILSMG